MKLDIGCGFNKQPDSVGIDLRRTYKFPDGETRKSQADIIADATKLPFKRDAFDEVYSCRCIQHIEWHACVFFEIRRVLKPNGKATVILASWRGWLYYKFKWLFRKKPYSIFHRYNNYELCRLAPHSKISYVGKGLHRDFKVEFK